MKNVCGPVTQRNFCVSVVPSDGKDEGVKSEQRETEIAEGEPLMESKEESESHPDRKVFHGPCETICSRVPPEHELGGQSGGRDRKSDGAVHR